MHRLSEIQTSSFLAGHIDTAQSFHDYNDKLPFGILGDKWKGDYHGGDRIFRAAGGMTRGW